MRCSLSVLGVRNLHEQISGNVIEHGLHFDSVRGCTGPLHVTGSGAGQELNPNDESQAQHVVTWRTGD